MLGDKMNRAKPTYTTVGAFAVLFIIADVFLALTFAVALPSAMPMLWILVVLEAFALIVLFARAVWWSLPRSVRRTLQDL